MTSLRPTGLLARETNGDLALLLPRWRARAGQAVTDTDRQALSRAVGRRLVRTGFTLIMPRWGGWTSDLDESAALFGRYYPERAAQMRLAAATGRTSVADPAVLGVLIDDLGPWLASGPASGTAHVWRLAGGAPGSRARYQGKGRTYAEL